MITPIIPPGPVPALYAATPDAARPAGTELRVATIDPGHPRESGTLAADPRRVPPPPRIASIPPERPLRGDRSDAAGRQQAGPDRPDVEPEFEAIAAGQPQPSSTFLAQAIGQELDTEAAGTAGPRPGERLAGSVAALYRETRETVERARFRGLTLPPDPPA